jgi:hypothetical protein
MLLSTFFQRSGMSCQEPLVWSEKEPLVWNIWGQFEMECVGMSLQNLKQHHNQEGLQI